MSSQTMSSRTSAPALTADRPNTSDGVERRDLRLAGVIGSQLSEPLAAMQYVLQEFDRIQNISRSHIQLLKTSVDLARTVARQSQQITRLAEGRLRQSHEKLKLDELLRNALLERTRTFQQRGVELYHSLKPVEVIVDGGLLSSLIDAALDWGLSMGQRLVVTLEMKNWPEHGMLLVKASDSVGAGTPSDDRHKGDTLGWYLLSEIARAMGVSVDRVTCAGEASLMIEFPRTVKRLEGLTAVEVDTEDDTLNSDYKSMAGHRLLVITDDQQLRHEIRATACAMGLVIDFVANTELGVRFCELDRPHMLIIDEHVRDPIFDELRRDLRNTDPSFPFIEIASEPNTLEVAGWMSDSMTRVSRDSLRAQLPCILVMELAKVM